MKIIELLEELNDISHMLREPCTPVDRMSARLALSRLIRALQKEGVDPTMKMLRGAMYE